ncbi:serine/threonine protein kinase [Paenibacillus albiflavus]|uniref:Serine/threonine protein kinase n=1 Tax=Paenibacillus albiflavus TaxID=2545760 RepID=A0A4R4EH36_9BACL|nr:stage VI sporulation protein F [Paenibacillus albiflavus]TCZ79416.1 serine/threonine protein kinase [Paenibacillus albiflavus]
MNTNYAKYGLDPALVERVKLKLKNKDTKEKVKAILDGVTKEDLQNRPKVNKLVGQVSKVLGENLTSEQTKNVVDFVIAQKIDPNNTFHLLKLWGMFR